MFAGLKSTNMEKNISKIKNLWVVSTLQIEAVVNKWFLQQQQQQQIDEAPF